ncbi:MAG: orotidine-5'-phosphate decarboxylase [Gammaproteobacteria bacterium]
MASPPDGKESHIIVALDFPTADQCLKLVTQLEPQQCKLKVGFELFVSAGPELVKSLVTRGFDVFLDLKFHDIPNTVAAACRAASELGVWMINVHAAGGSAMLDAAREAVDASGHRPKLIAVTVLTSLGDKNLQETGLTLSAAELAVRYARAACDRGLDGVVCSAHEVAAIKRASKTDFLCVTPGIRSRNSATNDQRRVVTPEEAIRAGADYLVIGRPVTKAARPSEALAAMNCEVLQGFRIGGC